MKINELFLYHKKRNEMSHKLKAEGKTAYPFSALADPSANKWFTNQKSGKSIFIILFNFVYVFENPVHVQMQLN